MYTLLGAEPDDYGVVVVHVETGEERPLVATAERDTEASFRPAPIAGSGPVGAS